MITRNSKNPWLRIRWRKEEMMMSILALDAYPRKQRQDVLQSLVIEVHKQINFDFDQHAHSSFLASDQMQALLSFAESNQQLWWLQLQSLAATIGINQVWNSKTVPRKHKNLNTTTGKALTTRERERKGVQQLRVNWPSLLWLSHTLLQKKHWQWDVQSLLRA